MQENTLAQPPKVGAYKDSCSKPTQAANVAEFGSVKGCRISIWASNRDNECDNKYASATCSGENFNGVKMQTKPFQYAKTIKSAYNNNTNSSAINAAKLHKFEREVRKQQEQSNWSNKNKGNTPGFFEQKNHQPVNSKGKASSSRVKFNR